MYIVEIFGFDLKIETNNDVFSPSALDSGTRAMLEACDMKTGDKVLDLGCGCGIVGIAAAKLIGAENVVLSDISENALDLAEKNAELNDLKDIKIIKSDGFREIDENGFTQILCNPPYHEDFSVPKHFIEKGFNRLVIGGRLTMVVKRRDWYKNKLVSVFGGVKIIEDNGYFVMTAEKRSDNYAKMKNSGKTAAFH